MKVGVMSRKEYKLLDHISDLVKTTGPPPGKAVLPGNVAPLPGKESSQPEHSHFLILFNLCELTILKLLRHRP